MTTDEINLWLQCDYYPITIIADRYTGTYSGGAFTALPLYYHEIPENGPDGSDMDCREYWSTIEVPYGIGSSPDEAMDDLINKMIKLKVMEDKQ